MYNPWPWQAWVNQYFEWSVRQEKTSWNRYIPFHKKLRFNKRKAYINFQNRSISYAKCLLPIENTVPILIFITIKIVSPWILRETTSLRRVMKQLFMLIDAKKKYFVTKCTRIMLFKIVICFKPLDNTVIT